VCGASVVCVYLCVSVRVYECMVCVCECLVSVYLCVRVCVCCVCGVCVVV